MEEDSVVFDFVCCTYLEMKVIQDTLLSIRAYLWSGYNHMYGDQAKKIRIFLHPKYAYLLFGTGEGMLATNICLYLVCFYRGYSVKLHY